MARSYKEGDTPIPGYRLKMFLGRGGFGEVWRATAPGGFEVAMKFINLSGKPGQKERKAMQLVKSLRHPNLTPVTAVWLRDEAGDILPEAEEGPGFDTPTPKLQDTMMVPVDILTKSVQGRPVELVIAMGLADKSLFDRLQECQREGLPGIPTPELMSYMEDAARAIDYLNKRTHSRGGGEAVAVQHCDIKPHNILIVSGAAQVCDFGLARVMGDVQNSSAAAGTIAYAAPECIKEGKPSDSTDQYSLALTYLELKTGALPYDSESWMEVLSAVQQGNLNFSKLPEAEQVIIKKATSQNPGERYPSAMEMIQALREVAMPGQRTVVMPRGGKQDQQAPSKGGGGILVAVVLLLAVMGGLGYGGFKYWDFGGNSTTKNDGPTNGGNTIVIPPVDHRAKGDEHAKKGENLSAIKEYSLAIVAAPHDVESLFNRGVCYLKEKNYDLAIRDFQSVVALDPNNERGFKIRPEIAQAYSERGDKLFKEEKYKLAIDQYSMAIESKEDDVESFYKRGVCYLKEKNYDLAIKDFQSVVSLDPSDVHGLQVRPEIAQAYSERGEKLVKEERYEPAEADFEHLLSKLRIESPAAHFGRGLCRLNGKRYDDAIQDFKKAMSLDPKPAFAKAPELVLAYLGRGDALLTADKTDEALADFNAVLEIEPKNPIALLQRGTVRLRERHYDEALPDLSAAIDLLPMDARGYSRRGHLYFQQKKIREAISDLSFAIKIDPHPIDLKNRGLSYLNQKTYDRAIDDFTAIIELTPKDAEAYYYRGDAYLETNLSNKAIEDYSESIKLDPKFVEPRLTRATVYIAQEKYAQAIEDLNAAQRLDYPDLELVYQNRAVAYEGNKQLAEAQADNDIVALFAKIEQKPDDPAGYRELAFVLATSRQANIRHGKKARSLAEQACKLTDSKDAACLDALAASHAEIGDYVEAVKVQDQAVALAPDATTREQYQARRKLYESERPFRP